MRSGTLVAAAIWAAGVAAEPVSTWNAALSSPLWESHPAVDPVTGDIWFVRSSRDFSGWKLFRSSCRSGRLTEPAAETIAGPGLEADPWFTPDGRTMLFISTGEKGGMGSQDLDIWQRTRSGDGQWSPAERLPAPVNSAFAEWFPRQGPDGWLYFGSRRPGGMGKDDIWRARRTGTGAWKVENAGLGLNSPDAEYEFQPAPSGRWGLLATNEGLVRVQRHSGGWRRLTGAAAGVASTGTEIGPLILADDRSFLFSRDTSGSRSGEILLARFGDARLAGAVRGGDCRRGKAV